MNPSDQQIAQATIYAQVASQSNQVYFIYDLEEKKFLDINEAFENVWGRARVFILQSVIVLLETVHPEDKDFVRDQYERLLKEKQRKRMEFRILKPDNSVSWICLTAYIIEHGAKQFLSGYCEDITHSKEYFFNIAKFNSKKDSTLEILSHDLAAPFAVIEGMSGLIEKKIQKGDLNIETFLGFIKENARRGINLIRDFVGNEFLESSQVVLHKFRLDIVQKITHIIDNYKLGEQLIDKQFEITSSTSSIYMEFDEMKFMQVINNLISNAIKFTKDNGKISIHIEDQGQSVLITIQDNGIGIPKPLQDGLFDKFTKARRPGIKGEKSVGLGMSIIKNIIQLHNGNIWFESEENKGSTFYIQLPKE